jgi:hypothetical protein
VLEALFLIAIVAVPLLGGAVATYIGRPWWWAAVVAVVLLFAFAIIPPPEEGESRLVAGDLVFLAVLALVAVGLVWIGAWLVRRWLRSLS